MTSKVEREPVARSQEPQAIPAGEPLLPVEKRLVAWSIGLGAVLLVVLAWLTRVALSAG